MIYRSKSGGAKTLGKDAHHSCAGLCAGHRCVRLHCIRFGLLNAYNVDIVVDGVTTTVTTREEKPTEILTNANITMESTDKLAPFRL